MSEIEAGSGGATCPQCGKHSYSDTGGALWMCPDCGGPLYQASIPPVREGPGYWQRVATELDKLLDDIDTCSDAYKPTPADPESVIQYCEAVNALVQQRHQITVLQQQEGTVSDE